MCRIAFGEAGLCRIADNAFTVSATFNDELGIAVAETADGGGGVGVDDCACLESSR